MQRPSAVSSTMAGLPKNQLEAGVDLPQRPVDPEGIPLRLHRGDPFYLCPACLKTSWAIRHGADAVCQHCRVCTPAGRGQRAEWLHGVYTMLAFAATLLLLQPEEPVGPRQSIALLVATAVAHLVHWHIPTRRPDLLARVVGGVRLTAFRPHMYWLILAIPTFLVVMALTLRLLPD